MILEDIKDQNHPNVVNWMNILQENEDLEQQITSSKYGARL